MKKNVLWAVALIIGVAVAFGMARQGDAKALNVNEIGADPAAFTGTITVTGIMAGVSKYDKDVIGIMDIKELQCTTPNCNKIYIPVKVSGKLPVAGDEIRATGQFRNEASGYIFAAETLKVVKNHKIGG